MNMGAIGALIVALGVFVYGLILTAGESGLRIFYDFPSLFIVSGGVIAAAVLSFQFKKTSSLILIGIRRFLKGSDVKYSVTIEELVKAIDSYRKGESLKKISENTKDFFFADCLRMLEDGVLTQEQAFELMEERKNSLFYTYNDDAGRLKILGKYPPAFGMMGTTMGMIVLLANLSGADAIKRVGPAMGVCLITTLYGVVLANFMFLPIADNLVANSKELFLKNTIIIEGVKCLLRKDNPIVATEKLNSFLLPSERLDWKKVVGVAR
jgi:chemotaxis protein MotA